VTWSQSIVGLAEKIAADQELAALVATGNDSLILQITGNAEGGGRIQLSPEDLKLVARLGLAVEFAPRTKPPQDDAEGLF
jgi:hypothetical protein